MDKLVAVVFSDEKPAYEAVRAFSQMDAEGSLDVAMICMMKKELNGTVSTKQFADHFPIRTLAGSGLGALIGILAGPIGAGAGAAAGALAGMIGDLNSLDVDGDFLSDIEIALTPGKCAVIADVDEEWVTPLDTRMEALGGVVYRTLRSTVRQDRWKRETEGAKVQLEQLRTEFAQASAERKAKLQAQIDRLSQRIDAKLAFAKERSEQATREFHARVRALQQKADRHKGDAKAAVEARIAKLRRNLSEPYAPGVSQGETGHNER